MSAYTVQLKGEAGWADIAVVDVPHRTKRRTIITQALEKAGYKAGAASTDDLTVRVLDEASAREVPVTTKNRDPEWEIG